MTNELIIKCEIANPSKIKESIEGITNPLLYNNLAIEVAENVIRTVYFELLDEMRRIFEEKIGVLGSDAEYFTEEQRNAWLEVMNSLKFESNGKEVLLVYTLNPKQGFPLTEIKSAKLKEEDWETLLDMWLSRETYELYQCHELLYRGGKIGTPTEYIMFKLLAPKIPVERIYREIKNGVTKRVSDLVRDYTNGLNSRA